VRSDGCVCVGVACCDSEGDEVLCDWDGRKTRFCGGRGLLCGLGYSVMVDTGMMC